MNYSAIARFELGPRASRSDEPDLGSGLSKGQPDEKLFEQVQQGNRDALAALFLRHAGHIRNVGQKILRDATEADDLVQEVFLYLHKKCALYDPSKGTARSWLIQVAYTQAFLRR